MEECAFDNLILTFATVCMKTDQTNHNAVGGTQQNWVRTPIANRVRYKPSDTYFARVRIRGKLFLHTMKTIGVAPISRSMLGFILQDQGRRRLMSNQPIPQVLMCP